LWNKKAQGGKGGGIKGSKKEERLGLKHWGKQGPKRGERKKRGEKSTRGGKKEQSGGGDVQVVKEEKMGKEKKGGGEVPQRKG